VQYEAAGAWRQAAELWSVLGQPLKQAEALEQHARSLESRSCSDEERAAAWAAAAEVFRDEGEIERVAACRREFARCLEQPIIILEVQHQGLLLNAWSRLQFIVRNEGYGPARNLIIRASGDQFEGQVTTTRQIATLRAGQKHTDWLDIRPRAYGDSVPMRVGVGYKDCAGEDRICEQTIYIPVERTEMARGVGAVVNFPVPWERPTDLSTWLPHESRQEPSQISQCYALLIGVGTYTHPCFTSLPATVRDARAIADILTDPARCGYPPANVQVLTGEQASTANISAAFEMLAESISFESTVFIYFSGHGGRALENGVWRAYLCPREADPDDLTGTAISGDEFSALLGAIPASKLLVMLDACHSAGSAELKAADGAVIWKTGLPDDYYEALSRGSGRVIIASSGEGQYSYIRQQGDLSLFTWHLHEALSGEAAVRSDGLIHVLDVFHHVNEAVQADEPKQTPILKVKDLDLNFPIALDLGGKGIGSTLGVTDVATIREQIVCDPVGGAKALSEYLAARPKWAAKRNEVDLKRADLERIHRDLDLFGPNPSDQVAKNRTVYFLLRVCFEIEQQQQ
jgi:hypothetical protein